MPSDWQEVARVQSQADSALSNVRGYGNAIEEGRTANPSLALLIAAEAICLELRAFATLEYHLARWVK